MKALVTGASGHLGYHICKLLATEGYIIRAFIRHSSQKEHLSKLPVEICFGDVFNEKSLKSAMNGMNVVFHTAAVYKLTEAKYNARYVKDDPIIKTAVEGTRNLYRAASESGVEKIIYTSSVETIGLTYDKSKFLDESFYVDNGFYPYSLAKIESERIALDLAKKYNLTTVVCNPSTIIGKDDYKPTPSNKMLLNFIKFNTFYVDGGQSFVDVEDVAHGHLRACLKGKNMERYILGGENIEVGKLMELIREYLNIRGPLFKLNKLFLYPVAFFLETIASITNKEPFITKRKVLRSIGSYSYYDCSKAKKELGYSPKNLNETLPDTLRWLKGRYG